MISHFVAACTGNPFLWVSSHPCEWDTLGELAEEVKAQFQVSHQDYLNMKSFLLLQQRNSDAWIPVYYQAIKFGLRLNLCEKDLINAIIVKSTYQYRNLLVRYNFTKLGELRAEGERLDLSFNGRQGNPKTWVNRTYNRNNYTNSVNSPKNKGGKANNSVPFPNRPRNQSWKQKNEVYPDRDPRRTAKTYSIKEEPAWNPTSGQRTDSDDDLTPEIILSRTHKGYNYLTPPWTSSEDESDSETEEEEKYLTNTIGI